MRGTSLLGALYVGAQTLLIVARLGAAVVGLWDGAAATGRFAVATIVACTAVISLGAAIIIVSLVRPPACEAIDTWEDIIIDS